ncbi:MAG: hypothetical protein FJW23_09275 [Acidimicrobiia bacterium]|nr:hypothetical protein [Acidimicrobiia bacterium]
MTRVRVASLQYFIRPIERYEQFVGQVTGLVETAADYECQLVVFPECFTLQIPTPGDFAFARDGILAEGIPN